MHQVSADYTLAERVSTRIPSQPRSERAALDWGEWLLRLPPVGTLGDRRLGEIVVDHRTSWVRRLATSGGTVYVKTYEYSTWASRLRELGRWTGPWARPRAVREFDALEWLRTRVQSGPRPLAALVERRLCYVYRATLLTTAHGDGSAASLLPQLAPAERQRAGLAIVAFVRRVHELGFRDRNLDLRNLLLTRAADGWQVAKIDSPRHVLQRPGPADDALARADWARLLPQLRALGVDVGPR